MFTIFESQTNWPQLSRSKSRGSQKLVPKFTCRHTLHHEGGLSRHYCNYLTKRELLLMGDRKDKDIMCTKKVRDREDRRIHGTITHDCEVQKKKSISAGS